MDTVPAARRGSSTPRQQRVLIDGRTGYMRNPSLRKEIRLTFGGTIETDVEFLHIVVNERHLVIRHQPEYQRLVSD